MNSLLSRLARGSYFDGEHDVSVGCKKSAPRLSFRDAHVEEGSQARGRRVHTGTTRRGRVPRPCLRLLMHSGSGERRGIWCRRCRASTARENTCVVISTGPEQAARTIRPTALRQARGKGNAQ